jgi:hypothetical protein
MTDELAAVTRLQIPKIERQFAALGPLQSISVIGVGLDGWDFYEVKFANGISCGGSSSHRTRKSRVSCFRLDWARAEGLSPSRLVAAVSQARGFLPQLDYDECSNSLALDPGGVIGHP